MNHSQHHSEQIEIGANPCTDQLTDLEYLEHMIPHHQVAIDMSKRLEPHISSDIILSLCREIIRKQKYEIWEMESMKKYRGDLFSEDEWTKENITTKLELYNPIMSQAEEGPCNPLFFKPNDHSKHMLTMENAQKAYLEHMIPHHQAAIDMSRRLLLHTNNSYLLDFCRKLIIDQQGEIFYMNNLLQSHDRLYNSELLGNKSTSLE